MNLEKALTIFQLPLKDIVMEDIDPMFFSYEIIDHCGSLEKLLSISLKTKDKKNYTLIEVLTHCIVYYA
jgi:hypothetical protein